MTSLSTNSLNPLARVLNFKVSTLEIRHEMMRRARALAKTAKVSGFRPGKAPVETIKHIYEGQIHYESLNYVTYTTFVEQAKKNNPEMIIAGDPSIEEVLGESNEEYVSFKATFEVFPEIDIDISLAQLEIETPTIELTHDDVLLSIDVIRQQNREYRPSMNSAQNNDRVTIDFSGRLEGVPFAGGTANDYPFTLGQGTMLPDFEAGILGKNVGDNFTIDVSFPQNYHSQEMAGKTTQFEITIKSIEEGHLPPLDEEFIKHFGIESGSQEEFHAEILENLKLESAIRLENIKKERVLSALKTKTDFPVPLCLLENESKKLFEEAQKEYSARKWDSKDLNMEQFHKTAEDRVRLALVLNAITKKHKFTAEHAEIVAKIKENAKYSDNPEAILKKVLKNKEMMTHFADEVIQKKMVAFILSKAKVTEVNMTFKELMIVAGQELQYR